MQNQRLTVIERTSAGARHFGRRFPTVALPAIALLVATLVGCARDEAATEKRQPVTSAVDTSAQSLLATIGDERVTMADLRTGRVGEQLDQLDAQYRRARDKIIGTALDTLVRDRLFAADAQKKGKTVEQLLSAEMPGGANPSDVEIETWYKDNKARVGGRSLDQLRTQIADLLRKQRQNDAIQKLAQRLKSERKVTVSFEPYRLQFANEGAPTLGPKDAPVTLVEFSDFQCPFCRAAAPTLKQVEEKFGDKVHVVYRQFPLNIHPFAQKAAEASLCANDQGKFWQIHDAMFEDQNKLTVSDLKQTARRLGMDGKKFDACLDSGRYVEQVQNDQKEGQRVGVNGTPAMFINGVVVEGGSVPFSVLEAAIQKELARGKPRA
jgi:protein-disulfide isomerase